MSQVLTLQTKRRHVHLRSVGVRQTEVLLRLLKTLVKHTVHIREVHGAFQISIRVLLPENSALPPGRFPRFGATTRRLTQSLLFIINLVEIFFNLVLLLQKVVPQLSQIAHPLLFNRIIIACEPPRDLLPLTPGNKLLLLA